MTTGLRYGACTDVGLVREVNEDAEIHHPPVFAVADGMGGHSAGDVASAMAIKLLDQQLKDSEALTAAVRTANRAIYEKASSDPDLSGMGTTITAMYANKDSAQIVHVGDSRAYLLRRGELSRITQDHTVVGRLVQQGRISPEDADRHPQRSYLERALGVDPHVEVDVHVLETMPGDRILLCSDGLHGMIDDDQILGVLKKYSDPQKAAEGLCRAAVEAGGTDNVTAVIVDYPDEPTEIFSTPISSRQFGSSGRHGVGSFASARSSSSTIAPERATRTFDPASRRPSPEEPPVVKPPKRRRPFLTAVAIVALLAAAGLLAFMSITRSWYVGSDDGRVAIFNGVSGSIGGLKLSHVETRTDIPTASLPELYRGRLEEGIPARSLQDARSIVRDLEALSRPAPEEPSPPAESPPPVDQTPAP
ncbi:MAG: Stp1/IreP family PP2C-type Ser/Thr phosphatase [Actinomycetota bacterium]|nr:Stp1/IreP family PP2C-type Ser/Thr phosphatase [Actinomycetota bacterium]